MSTLAIHGGPKLRTAPFPGWPRQDPRYLEALSQVLEHGTWGVGGPRNRELVQRFREVCDAQHCISCTNGTAALELSLRAIGVGAGDEVIVPPYTFIATASAVVSTNAIPVFADIRPDTFCLDAVDVERKITPSTRAVIAVHIGGMPCDLRALQEVCTRRGLKLVEDCAQAHGAVYAGRKVGGLGDVAGFSFQSSKNIASGEGGMVTTNAPEVFAKAWSYANIGRVPDGAWYDHRIMGWNLRLTEFQAALILCQLDTYQEDMARRDANAEHLRQRFAGIEGITPQAFSPGAERSAYHLFIARYDRNAFKGLPRDRFLAALSAEGVPASRGYNPLYREGMFTNGWEPEKCPWACSRYRGKVDYRATSCPVCEHACADGSFWLYQSVLLGTPQDMDDIADAILKVRDQVDDLLG